MTDLDRTRAELSPEAQLNLYECLDAWAACMGDHATDALMSLVGMVPVAHGPAEGYAHDPDLQTAARKVAIRWLTNQGVG